MVNIIKEEVPIEESLKRKLELICEFPKTTPTIINGNIRKIDKYIDVVNDMYEDEVLDDDGIKNLDLNKEKDGFER